MQMWDEASPMPLRPHVNPNALVLEADGLPLTVDGTPDPEVCRAFDYEDTWREVGYLGPQRRRMSFGKGCGGAHSVLLIDGWESLRPKPGYDPQRLEHFDADAAELVGDVTGLYRSVYPDTRRVLRRSRLIDNTFWIVEDLA
ncbi:MAG: hypothetical protein ACOC93_05480, partial [Planctomycetota bacterium]